MTTIQFHILQSLPPNLINRDENSRQKTAYFGGALRTRVSSQAFKAAIRNHPVWDDMPRSTRSRGHVAQLAEELKSKTDKEETRTAIAAIVMEACFGKLAEDRQSLMTNTFLAPDEFKMIADLTLEYWDELLAAVPPKKGEAEGDKAFARRAAEASKIGKTVGKKIFAKTEKSFIHRTTAYDLALFGRMLASAPTLGMEGAVSVNHAFTVNKVAMESDFFTGMDDLENQASMLDFTDYTSGVLYRYMMVDYNQLVRNLSGDIDYANEVLKRFMFAMTRAIPSGKSASFGDSRSLPDFLLAEIRKDNYAYSLANAFEAPIQARNNQGLVSPAAAALDAYWKDQKEMWGTAANYAFVLKSARIPDESLQNLSEKVVPTFSTWVENVVAALEV